jgi:hypothetical protein
MKTKNILVGIGIVIIIIVGGWIIFCDKTRQIPFPESLGIPQENLKKEMVSLVIDDGEGMPKNFEVQFYKGITAFDLLKKKAEELNMVLKTKTYDIGIFIEAIGDKENGQDGKYWMYYVNGVLPMVAADKKEIKPGDKIEFRFEKSPF